MPDKTSRSSTDAQQRGDQPAARSRGTSLVEILVAVCILAVAIVVLATLFPVAVNYQQKTLYMQIASAEARGTLDRLLAEGYDSLSTGVEASSVANLPDGNVKAVQIEPYPTSDAGYLKLITVKIVWPGKEHAKYLGGQVTCRTLAAKPYKETDGCYADI